jgi:hypothetical protein
MKSDHSLTEMCPRIKNIITNQHYMSSIKRRITVLFKAPILYVQAQLAE